MSMSKKDFIALADVIRNLPVTAGEDGGEVVDMDILEDTLADFCRSQNPRFMRERWLDYIAGRCGKNDGKVAA